MTFVRNPLRFSLGWEDYQVIEAGLQPKQGDAIIAILASGDIILNLLRFEPSVIYGVDFNPAQIHEVRLKLAAIEHLNHSEFLTLLGFSGYPEERLQLYTRLAPKLAPETNAFWHQYRTFIRKGVSFQGWMEQFYTLTGRILRFFLADQFTNYLSAQTREERQHIFDKRLNRPMLRALTKIFMNNRIAVNVLYQRQATKNIPSTFDYQASCWRNFYHAFVDIGCVNNPYLTYLMTGKMPNDPACWPPYLKEEYYPTLQRNLAAVTLLNTDLCSGLCQLSDDSIDCFSLSDIFDWMDLSQIEAVLQQIIRVGRKNARIISFILNYDKGIPPSVQRYYRIDEKTSVRLQALERLGFYSKINLLILSK
jgi:S-adenosylmethionine-diacylglycerol 3-amino-3-carboxypropyl transferase